MKKSFTLMELLIVIALLVLIAIAVLIALNPWGQINKSNDGKRKHELTQLNKLFEDFYNDKNCYPAPAEVCYNDTGWTTCNICGNESTPPNFSNFSPYMSRLPCDPRQPNKKYLYQVDNASCPSWYRIYTTLSNQSDLVIAEVGCSAGCGPSPDFNYNYGVSSPNVGLEGNTNFCRNATALYINPVLNPNCDICGSQSNDGPPPGPYENCKADSPSEIYYTDPGSCTTTCIKD